MTTATKIMHQLLHPQPLEPWTVDEHGERVPFEWRPEHFEAVVFLPFDTALWSMPRDERPEPRGKAEGLQRAAADLHREIEHAMAAAPELWQLRAVAERQKERRLIAMASRYWRAVESGSAEPSDDYERIKDIADERPVPPKAYRSCC